MGGRIWVESEVGRGQPLPLHRPPRPWPTTSRRSRRRRSRPACTGCGCWWSTTTPPTAASSRKIAAQLADGGRHRAGSATEALRAVAAGREPPASPSAWSLTDAHMPRRRRLRAGRADPQRDAHCQHGGHDAHLRRPARATPRCRGAGHRRLPAQADQAVGAAWRPSKRPWAVAVRRRGRAPGRPPRRCPPACGFLLAEDSLVNQKLAVALLEEQGHR